MRKATLFVALGTASALGTAKPERASVKFDPATHVAKGSTGCGKSSPYSLGKTTVATGEYAGVEWTYRVYMPSNYDSSKPLPIILQHPGWGMSAVLEEQGAGISALADQKQFISVTPQGMNDNSAFGGPWYSWNAVGTTDSPGPAGPTCTSSASNPSYCYTSCDGRTRHGADAKQPTNAEAGAKANKTGDVGYGSYSYGSYGSYSSYSYGTSGCGDTPQCDWTTCDETVTPTGTGTKDVGGFIPSLYDTLEEQLCIDLTRVYASGESNGGMQTYQLGVDLAPRLAAITPEFGSFHRGFAMSPSMSVPVLDLHGSKDTTVPANVSLSGDGYYYTTTKEIFDGSDYSLGWKLANGCVEDATHWVTQWDGEDDFYCVSECEAGDVVRCMWDGGHNWLFNNAKANGGLVTKFLLEWTKPSHAGFGRTEGDADVGKPGHPLKKVTIRGHVDTSPNVTAAFARLPTTLKPQPPAPLSDPRPPQLETLPLVPGYWRTEAQVPVAVPDQRVHSRKLVEEPTAAAAAAAAPAAQRARRPHYSNPSSGCRDDEDEVIAATGTSCAPKIASRMPADGDAEDALPAPRCQLGGASPHANGCPNDAAVAPWSKAFPVCLAKSADVTEAEPYRRGDFHCLLVCPCAAVDGESADCGAEAHGHCPRGARCERGELRNRAHGVCTYHQTS